ncbi:MAG: type II secretion system protein [Patescibacteria group bacterium]
MKKNQNGFTLIELLVVIAIIGLLSTLSVVALNSARARSRDARRVSDIKQIQTALEMYYNEMNSYPATSTDVTPTSETGTPGRIAGTATVYMEAVPVAPKPYDSTSCDDAKNKYVYTAVGTSAGTTPSYTLTYCLGSKVGTLAAGMNTSTQFGLK